MDIGSGNGYPSASLSNFSPHPFTFRDIPVNSMEGFLQGLKFENPEMQKAVFLLVGKAAKFKGKKKNWRRDQTLYFQGQSIKRDSQEYQDLLDEAYEAMFGQNESARNALLASGDAVLTHTIGKSNQSETVLTRSEFCSRLTKIRGRIKSEKQDE
jgi:predicted NAD-dependent protein-ADP-ribosyltransferase YbiA (DUF1768 family)